MLRRLLAPLSWVGARPTGRDAAIDLGRDPAERLEVSRGYRLECASKYADTTATDQTCQHAE